jgi:hypothetical protein
VIYSMSESDQYFYLKVTVDTGGVLDNVGNEYDANSETAEREGTFRYKVKIDSQGEITILEEVFE